MARLGGSYLQHLAASGHFPRLAELGAETVLNHDDELSSFETGLGWLLSGIAGQIVAPAASKPQRPA
jgi:hypothetical protein